MSRSARRVAGFELIRELGRGSMGVVYLARRDGLAQDVALKVIAASRVENPVYRERFRREAKMLARVRHPGVIRIHDAGEEGDLLWYAMDVVAGGRSLDDRVTRGGPLPEWEACELLGELASAVEAIHVQGIVHRDLKPENVLLDGVTGKPLIADFGLARQLESDESRLTKTGFSVGTPGYMSPEQVRASKDVDARADVYALGALLHFALTGRDVFACETIEDLVKRILDTPASPPSALVPSVSRAVDAVCLRALSKKREERQRSAAGFAVELAAAREPAPEPARRPRAALYVPFCAAAFALLLAAPAWSLLERRSLEAQEKARAAAKREADALAAENRKLAVKEAADARMRLAEGKSEAALLLALRAFARDRDLPAACAAYARALTPEGTDKRPDGPARIAQARAALERFKASREPAVVLARAHLLLVDRKRTELPSLLRDVLSRGDAIDRVDAAEGWFIAVGPPDESLLAPIDASLKELPSWGRAHYARGVVLQAVGRKLEAKTELDRAVQLSGLELDVRAARAALAVALDDWQGARYDMLALVEGQPDRPEPVFQLGTIEERLGQREEALGHYDRAIELWPRDRDCPFRGRRGLLLHVMGDDKRAEPDLEAAVRVFASAPFVRALGDCCGKLGKTAKARAAYEALVSANGQDVGAILELGAIREREDPAARCAAFYRAAVSQLKDAAARERVQGRLSAVEARIEDEKRASERNKVELAQARKTELDRRLRELRAAIDAAKDLPEGPDKEKRLADLRRELESVQVYYDETKKLIEKP